MPQTFANTIDNNEILAKRSQCDYAGNDIQQTYATKAELPTVPVTDVEVDGASVVNQGVAEITMPTVDQTYDSASSNAQSGVAMAGALANKQDTISDLSTIRSGAADGATAVQPGDLATVATTGAYSDLSGTPTIPPALSAGNGIDITNNVVSADLDGTSLTNGANGLSVTLPVPDTTGASQGDVLSVGQSGIEWTTPALTSDNVYKATATDTYATLYQAYMVDHKLVYYGEGYPLILKNLISDNSSNVSGRVYFQTSYMNTSKKVSIIYDEKRLAEGVPLGSLTNYTQEIIPASSGSHVGQFITPAANGIMAWATINQVPASTSADEDKVLTVDSTGSPVWATPSGGGSVTDVEVNGASVVNASGVAEVTVPAQVQPDWDATSGLGEILNKPTIPAAQVNSDWNASSGVAEILNKPTILPYKPVVAGTGVRIVDDTANNRIVVEADETVLFSGSSVASNIILSEAPNNFAYIRVEFRRSNSLQGFVSSVTLPVNSSSVSFPLMLVYCNVDNSTTYNEFIVRYNGNTTQNTFTFQYALKRTSVVGGSVTIATDTDPTLEVFKIVGVHRVASN